MFTTVLFDIDGVMLSEERYFDASALAVHELLVSPAWMNLNTISLPFRVDWTDDEITEIRNQVFRHNQVLEQLKNVGVNANWDMVYLVFVAELVAALRALPATETVSEGLQEALDGGWTQDTLGKLGKVIHQHGADVRVTWQGYDTLYANAKSRDDLFALARTALQGIGEWAGDDGALWHLCQSVFQDWYLGDTHSGKNTGKTGFLTSELPLAEPAALQMLFAALQAQNIQLGIATGRPRIETEVPLTHFGWWTFFTEQHVTTASDVLAAEEQVPTARPLSKPNPFCYLRSFKGIADVEKLLATALPLQGLRGQVLIVGDSIADALAAKGLGASFAAVLTGLEGELARPKFEQLEADYIFNNVLEVKSLFV